MTTFKDTNIMTHRKVYAWLNTNGFPYPEKVSSFGGKIIEIDFGVNTITAAQKTQLTAKFPNLQEA